MNRIFVSSYVISGVHEFKYARIQSDTTKFNTPKVALAIPDLKLLFKREDGGSVDVPYRDMMKALRCYIELILP